MTHYAIAQLNIHDPERYGRYVEAFMPTLNRYGGKVLAADTAPLVVEGQWPFQKLVLLAFDDADAFHRWEASPEYQAIVAGRKEGAAGPVILVRGV